MRQDVVPGRAFSARTRPAPPEVALDVLVGVAPPAPPLGEPGSGAFGPVAEPLVQAPTTRALPIARRARLDGPLDSPVSVTQ